MSVSPTSCREYSNVSGLRSNGLSHSASSPVSPFRFRGKSVALKICAGRAGAVVAGRSCAGATVTQPNTPATNVKKAERHAFIMGPILLMCFVPRLEPKPLDALDGPRRLAGFHLHNGCRAPAVGS